MKKVLVLVLLGFMVNAGSVALAQVAGTMSLGPQENMEVIARGWSAREDLLGKAVFNDQGQGIGELTDLIITPTRFVSYAIIGVGGFLGFEVYAVAIPLNYLKIKEGKIILPGADKEALKKLPPFHYAR
jgi:sporulation protein YlmC with PRC-barrel domain